MRLPGLRGRNLKLCIQHYEYDFPAKQEPLWASQVERWYQLDAPAYGLAQAYWELCKPSLTPPEFLILASAGASNETDLAFVQGGATSPSKFVHTLPSVRGASLLQVMAWQGPLLCVQNDPQTWLTGCIEGVEWAQTESMQGWLWQTRKAGASGRYQAALCQIGGGAENPQNGLQTLEIEYTSLDESRHLERAQTDADFWHWLKTSPPGSTFSLNSVLQLRKQR